VNIEAEIDFGCAYPLEDAPIRYCGCRRRPGSSYCEAHHALCYLPRGSRAEERLLGYHRWLARVGERTIRDCLWAQREDARRAAAAVAGAGQSPSEESCPALRLA